MTGVGQLADRVLDVRRPVAVAPVHGEVTPSPGEFGPQRIEQRSVLGVDRADATEALVLGGHLLESLAGHVPAAGHVLEKGQHVVGTLGAAEGQQQHGVERRRPGHLLSVGRVAPLGTLVSATVVGMTVSIEPLHCGTLTVPRSSSRKSAPRQAIAIPVPAWLIRHPQGVVLFDTGMSEELSHKSDYLEAVSALFQVGCSPSNLIGARLADHEVDVAEVDVVVLSHLHFDHVGSLPRDPRRPAPGARRRVGRRLRRRAAPGCTTSARGSGRWA